MHILKREQKVSDVIKSFNSTLRKIQPSLIKQKSNASIKTDRIRTIKRNLQQDQTTLFNPYPYEELSSYLSLGKDNQFKQYGVKNKQKISDSKYYLKSKGYKSQKQQCYQPLFFAQHDIDFGRKQPHKQLFMSLGSQNSKLRIQNNILKKKLQSVSDKLSKSTGYFMNINNSDISEEKTKQQPFCNSKMQSISFKIKQIMNEQIFNLKFKLKETEDITNNVLNETIDDQQSRLWKCYIEQKQQSQQKINKSNENIRQDYSQLLNKRPQQQIKYQKSSNFQKMHPLSSRNK